jgi:hypothetical protein
LQNPSLDSKVLFLGSAEDEFEIIEANADWVHVRISGLSRGWLRRSLVEVLDQPGREDVQSPIDRPEVSSNSSTSNAPFSVSSDELGSFPGGWEPLKGKTVKIVSVQPAVGARKITSSLQKLQFARGVFQKGTPESLSAGLVLIFDTEDGGMLAATGSDIEKWRKGTISEQAFWKGCYVDPPEMLGSVE